MNELKTTQALQQILWYRSKDSYTVWIRFQTDIEKVGAKDHQFAEQFGTRLLPSTKQKRKLKGLPTAAAVCTHVHDDPYKREIVLLATPLALNAHPASPWAKQAWKQSPPECDIYVMVHEPRERGDYTWTWRLQQHAINSMSRHLTSLVKFGDASAVQNYIKSLFKYLAMFGGVRRQVKQMLWSGQKLWTRCHGSPWPGAMPEDIPMMTKFKK